MGRNNWASRALLAALNQHDAVIKTVYSSSESFKIVFIVLHDKKNKTPIRDEEWVENTPLLN